ncbi:MAG: Bug family tripartite tricarboxylate transporter substrate binding protein [Pigmentiphaga sp.]|uniref:Bug family tripartite tricarboxylate transporter substrate binding protein n=1 Tax=Pigmentiphaga sp. TaxID=1977564 RepID=UPI003B56E04A
MRPKFARLGLSAALGIAATALTVHAAPQPYPTKPINIVTPLPAGSTVDVLARAFAQQLSQRLKTPVVVETKAGAGLMLAMQNVANAPADGYTLAFTPATPLSIQTHRHKNAGYTLESFVPLCQTFENIFYLAASPGSDIKDIRTLVDRLKKDPGRFSYGHSGIGSAPHLMTEEFLRDLNVRATEISYRGETALLPDLTSGQIDGGLVTTSVLLQHNYRPLVVFSTARTKEFPDVPTTAELGSKVHSSTYGGIFIRKDVPQDVLVTLEGACRDIVNSPSYQQMADQLQQTATYLDRPAFSRRVAADHASKGRLLDELNLKD